MEIPHLVRERLGDESVEASVNLGDDDVVCVTPTRTLVYRSEGLLSDESVSIYSHDVERFAVSEGRRKTKFVFEYVDGTDSLTVPGNRAESILKLLVGGILHVAGVTADGESVSDVFTFSELTLVVTSHRLVKHVGTPVWDEDFEEFPYDDVTGLSFEEGSVATQVVLSVDGRPQRIKAPSEEAELFKRSLQGALFAYHDVDTVAELNEKVGPDDDAPDTDDREAGGLSLDDGITPLVSDEDESADTGATGTSDASSAGTSPAVDEPDASDSRIESASALGGPEAESGGSEGGSGTATGSSGDRTVDTVSTSASAGETAGGTAGGEAIDPEEIEAMKRQLSTLTKAVKKQNELLRDQQETIDKLIEELRRGR